MARVTVEDCIERSRIMLRSRPARRASRPDDFVGPADHRRSRQRQEPGRRPPRNRRRDADAGADLEEDFIHSLQKHVEVDEPEAEGGARARHAENPPTPGTGEVQFDRMTEEDCCAAWKARCRPATTTEDDRIIRARRERRACFHPPPPDSWNRAAVRVICR